MGRRDKSYSITAYIDSLTASVSRKGGRRILYYLLSSCGQSTTFCHVFNNPWQGCSTQIKKFYFVFTRFEGFCIEWKQKQIVVIVVGHLLPPPNGPYPQKLPLFLTSPLSLISVFVYLSIYLSFYLRPIYLCICLSNIYDLSIYVESRIKGEKRFI